MDGDGTVPAESATAHGLEPAGSAAVDVSHRGLVGSQASAPWGCNEGAERTRVAALRGVAAVLVCWRAALPPMHAARPELQAVWEQVLRWLREPLQEPDSAAAPCAAPQQQLPPLSCAARWAAAAPAVAVEAQQAEVCLTMPLLAGQAGSEPEAVGGSEDGGKPEEACNPLVWWALL